MNSSVNATAFATLSTLAWLAVAFGCAPARADAAADAAAAAPASAAPVASLSEITVTAQRLDEARAGIQTQTGASTYTIDADAVAATPGGDNTLLNQVIMQAPEVAQDSFGQFHVRGEHNGLQYRLNGIILPEGISVFGQSLDPRLISSMSLITGALPAEYGLRTAGIIDLTTKNGLLQPGGAASIYGGSHGTVQPSINYGGGAGSFSYFVSGDMLRSDLGIESPDGSSNPVHDHTTQYHGFGYFEDILDPTNRVALMLGSSVGKFQIPDLRGEQPSLGLVVDAQSIYPSTALNENQQEITQFGALSWQHSDGAFNAQTSFVARFSSLTFEPDPLGDLLYTGIAQNAFKQNTAYALQSDSSYQLNDAHTLRAGVFLQTDHSISRTASSVLPTDASGTPLGDVPEIIGDDGARTEWIGSLYLQDEWKVVSNLTLNYGVRLDKFTAYTGASQASPRFSAVWQVLSATTLHAGYSRYLSPPPFELVGGKTVSKFIDTTSPPLSSGDTLPLPERADYFDVGVQQKVASSLTLGLDSYYKRSHNLIDEGQFGAPIILTPFNYRYGRQYGVEFSSNYTSGNFNAYLNLAEQSAMGRDIDSAQFNFSSDDLAYIANHYIHLDHEQQLTASGGVSYLLWTDTRLSADFLLGSGLRADLELPLGETTAYGGTGIPNGAHLPYYNQLNLGSTHVFHLNGAGDLTARFDVINLLDREYEIRNGTGVGVGAPQFGPRRGLFFGLSKSL
jgi:outer membrane receptor protein involved in Fe transport